MSFDDYAKNWDTDKRINRAKIISKEIIDLIDINNTSTAMEFGCGTGLISFNLYDKFKNITLIDSSKGMIDVLNSKIHEYKVGNMIPLKLDIFNEEALDKTFDVIYNSMVLHHIKDTQVIIKRFYELINKDGYLCIVDLNEEDGKFHKEYPDFDGHNGFNQEKLKGILSSEGFRDIESKTFFYDKKIIDGEEVNYSLFLIKAKK
ncbi:Ubiquinone/menaquinone biosynthesis C-methylase UbiE [Clostridium cavendishii DSM 21758]|uniref:Ubiquinone/menaquinone biosynthesis C-methylase UbiE n=1 Tax=Clostridium cavendishii DSM 21758 TaxID=1121302 RepID=A0A1M6I286_9CLOT|nr:class I SAM-dependent methyltransferase [Clostridium cavendishii]SHJ28364.1 Ubiquinone/menaquinone biosynthesis C-methylase UbiE [Clostridium cavendishii DSM 21758]